MSIFKVMKSTFSKFVTRKQIGAIPNHVKWIKPLFLDFMHWFFRSHLLHYEHKFGVSVETSVYLCLKTFQGRYYPLVLLPYSSQRWAWSKGSWTFTSVSQVSLSWQPSIFGDSGSEHHLTGVTEEDRLLLHSHTMMQVRNQNCLWSEDGQVRGSGLDQAERGERPGGRFVNIHLNFLKPWGDREQTDWASLHIHPATSHPGAWVQVKILTGSEPFSSWKQQQKWEL